MSCSALLRTRGGRIIYTLTCSFVLLVASGCDEGPLLQGKPMSYWEAQTRDLDGPTRTTAIQYLAAFGVAARPLLVETLRRDAPHDRAAAARALGSLGEDGRPAVTALLETLADESWFVRQAAVQALGWLQTEPEQVVPALAARLRDEQTKVREAAIQALGNFEERARPALAALEALRSTPDFKSQYLLDIALQKISGS